MVMVLVLVVDSLPFLISSVPFSNVELSLFLRSWVVGDGGSSNKI
jgi:hypothetical protein